MMPPPPIHRSAPGLPPRPALKAWPEVLALIGYPPTCLTLDFETYFDDAGYGFDTLSTIEYVTDKRFEVLGLGWLTIEAEYPHRDHEANAVFEQGEEAVAAHFQYLKGQYGQNLERATCICHNAPFDALVLAHHYGISPPHVLDTRDLAAAWSSRERHDLKALCKRWKLKEKGDTMKFSGVTRRRRFYTPKGRGAKIPLQRPLITPEQEVALADYGRNDISRTWELFTLLLPRLSRPEVEAKMMRHTLGLYLQPSLRVDFELGKRLESAFSQEIVAAIETAGITSEEASGNLSFEGYLCQALERAGDVAQRYFKPKKPEGYKLAEAKTDPERELLLNHKDEKVRALMNARVACKSWPLHISRIQGIMNQAQCLNGSLGVPLRYYSAHTGRWGGYENLNLQNLPKAGLLAQIRGLLIAPPGYVLVIADASQIEARIVAWLAGETNLCRRFESGEEIYCGFASKLAGKTLRKAKKDDPAPLAAYLTKWRNLGKVGVLACGYGMGASRAYDYANGEPYNCGIDALLADRLIQLYRAEFPLIPKFWYAIEAAFKYTAKYRNPGALNQQGRILARFDSLSDCDVCMTLPSGREMHYPQVRVVQEDRGEKIETWNGTMHCWDRSWGGGLTENLDQAIARDILAEAMLRLEARGLHTCLHVHDEVVIVAKEEEAEKVKAAAIEELSRTPAWAPGLPLAAEGRIERRYCK